MPASLAKSLIEAHKTMWQREQGLKLAASMLDMASLTPAFGVSK